MTGSPTAYDLRLTVYGIPLPSNRRHRRMNRARALRFSLEAIFRAMRKCVKQMVFNFSVTFTRSHKGFQVEDAITIKTGFEFTLGGDTNSVASTTKRSAVGSDHANGTLIPINLVIV